jgi:2-polyprenyl-6-methoxyphenol hydroxylase-like FAD-dependent oxidoreductase
VAKNLVLGAALGGLQTALLPAEDSHDVTVLERWPRRIWQVWWGG